MYKKIKQKMFWINFGVMAIVGSLAAAGVFFSGEKIRYVFNDRNAEQMSEVVSGLLAILGQGNFYYWALPIVIGLFVLLGILLWAVVTGATRSLLAIEEKGEAIGKKGTPAKKDFIDQKIEQERRQRLFLHSLSILQREGRLLDFFEEDLSHYEDDQIGAAVRSIQEDCKNAIKKYIDPRPVVEGNEGDIITIEDGFDIDAINLVGNVAGHPPFSGVIKHPGWRAGKKEVPKLSDVQDATIMTPAEVEIQ